jgi:RNA recognition motif-containing protein
LYKTFESFGTIASAKMSIDASFNSRGFGFVSFETSRAVNKAIKEVNGKKPRDLEPVV